MQIDWNSSVLFVFLPFFLAFHTSIHLPLHFYSALRLIRECFKSTHTKKKICFRKDKKLEPFAFSLPHTGSERQRLLSQAGAEASWVVKAVDIPSWKAAGTSPSSWDKSPYLCALCGFSVSLGSSQAFENVLLLRFRAMISCFISPAWSTTFVHKHVKLLHWPSGLRTALSLYTFLESNI